MRIQGDGFDAIGVGIVRWCECVTIMVSNFSNDQPIEFIFMNRIVGCFRLVVRLKVGVAHLGLTSGLSDRLVGIDGWF